jgi:quercetin dioxygenase-like cupin family protein
MRKFILAAAVLATASVISIGTAMSADAPGAPTVVRTPLMAGDAPGGDTLTMMQVTIPPGGNEGRHIHSGPLIVHVISGAFTLDYEGKPTVTYKAGQTFFVEAGKQHEGHNIGTVPAVGIAAFATPKGAPITTQIADKDVKK